MSKTVLCLPAASDMHLHLRQNGMARAVAPFTARQCHRCLVMPNTSPAIEVGQQAVDYKTYLQKLMPDVDILTTIKLIPMTRPEHIREAARMGVSAVKLYPDGVTTNSHGGITAEWLRNPPQNFLDCIDMIRMTGMVLCMHGEMPGEETNVREEQFLPFPMFLSMNFPKLKMVLEHISTAKQVETVRFLQKSKCHVAATITAHHLFMTMDDVIGDMLRPHNFCKPVAKWKADRAVLRHAAMNGEPCFFLGSDSAPHDVGKKECSSGCAGCFTAPVLVESLIEVFEDCDKLSALPNFISNFGNDFYGCADKEIPIRKYVAEKWAVPSRQGGVRPWRAEETLKWKLTN